MKHQLRTVTRRRFLASAAAAAVLPAVLVPQRHACAAFDSASECVVEDPQARLGRTQAPVWGAFQLSGKSLQAAEEGRLAVREQSDAQPGPVALIPAQVLPDPSGGKTARVCWLLPAGPAGRRIFRLAELASASQPGLRAVREPVSGQCDLSQAGRPVLRYNYAAVQPGEVLGEVAPANRIYARARSDYIHPLYGPHGEMLTRDWSKDHPHHRGIYWAWPEVDWRGQRGDLHALQKVFARPAGPCAMVSGPVFAGITAENLWKWEDQEAMVRERVTLRSYRGSAGGRLIDLEFEFIALDEPVLLARRGTDKYGGLNVRLASVRNQAVAPHTDPSQAAPRRAWAEVHGVFDAAEQSAGVVILQHRDNPCYPGDWVQYPELNWLQPTFPAAGTRHELRKGRPLTLRYRLWIHAGGPASAGDCADYWDAFHAPAGLPPRS